MSINSNYANGFSAGSVVEMELEESLSESDLGILAGDKSPNGESILVIGKDGYANQISALDAGDRSKDVELITGRNVDLNDVSWHPRGQAALIAGDLGIALRYETLRPWRYSSQRYWLNYWS